MFWTQESGFSPSVESFPGSFSFVVSLITLNISSIFYIYLLSLLLWSALYKSLAMTMSFFFQEMLWTSHESSCLVVRSFQEKDFATHARFVLPRDRRPGLGTPIKQGTQRNADETCALKSPQQEEWAESFEKNMDSMHFPDTRNKEKPDYLENTEHVRLVVCGSLWVIRVVSTKKQLSH